MAPYLQPRQQLLARVVGAPPKRGELLAHGVHGLQRLGAFQRGREPLSIDFREGVPVGMEPLPYPLETWNVDRQLAAPSALAQTCDLSCARAPEGARVARQHCIAMRYDGLQRLQVGSELGAVKTNSRRDFAHGREANHLQRPDVHPPEIDLLPLRRQACRSAIGMMVVVQLFAADENAPGDDIPARALAGKIAEVRVTADGVREGS